MRYIGTIKYDSHTCISNSHIKRPRMTINQVLQMRIILNHIYTNSQIKKTAYNEVRLYLTSRFVLIIVFLFLQVNLFEVTAIKNVEILLPSTAEWFSRQFHCLDKLLASKVDHHCTGSVSSPERSLDHSFLARNLNFFCLKLNLKKKLLI